MNEAENWLADLEAKAKATTPGPWIQPGRCLVVSIVSKREPIIGDMKTVANATFIAANDPTTILADIDEILRLRAEVERLEKETHWLATAAANNGWHGVRVSPEWMREAARKAVEPENDRGWA